jgi:nicotinamide phosphoribosyltransferase
MEPLRRNLILDTDSYKASHFLQFPPGTTGMFSYLESRGGRFPTTIFFGLQYLMQEYLTQRVTAEDVWEAKAFCEAHGEPFPFEQWGRVVTQNGGYLPIRIRAIPEGTEVPTHNILMSVESTSPEAFWVTNWFETQIVRMWYPTTVATQSFYLKKLILEALYESADDPENEVLFKLHDFGGRGVSSRETAGVGGMAHLVNFRGSDTIEGVRYANHYYDCPMAGFSIPAAEHSTITVWGRHREEDAYRNMVKQFAQPGKLVACVSDSYNIYRAIEEFWCGSLLEEVQLSGATLVVRPDSGDPPEVVRNCLRIFDRKLGLDKNKKGFKVLPPYFRIIQGDGVDEGAIRDIYRTIMDDGFSASNVSFGSGGALLQKLNRDTQKFAFKCSEATVDGASVPVYKEPVTDPGKNSKRGRLDLVRGRDGGFMTVPEGGCYGPSELVPVFENGEILRRYTLDEVRENSEKSLRHDTQRPVAAE